MRLEQLVGKSMITNTEIQLLQLRSISSLVTLVFESRSLDEIARNLVDHVREGMPPSQRDPAYLATLSERLIKTLFDLYVSSQPISDEDTGNHSLSLMRALSGAEAEFKILIETVSNELEHLDDRSSSGAILRASTLAIISAAMGIASRTNNEAALSFARELEDLGAPPAVLFSSFGSVLWVNSSLRRLLERRSIKLDAVIKQAMELSEPAVERFRLTSDPVLVGKASVRNETLGLHFSLQSEKRGQSQLENFFVVQLSEAKRVTALSARESEIAVLLVEIGKYKDVAVAANISLDSVRTYVRRIYRKFGIHDRHELKARMIREGLIRV